MAVPILPEPQVSSPGTPPMSLMLLTDQPPDFVHPFEYNCGICYNSLLDPMQTKCGHRICRSCLHNHLSLKGDPSMCPYKEEDCEEISLKKNDGSVYPDYFLLKELKKLKVYCPYKSNGCPDQLRWGKLAEHEEACPYGRISCPHEALGCKTRPKIELLEEHLKDCPYRPTLCPHCNKANIPQILLNEHLKNDCPATLIDCSCGAKFLRSELNAHAQTCPSTPKLCKYHPAGCAFKGSDDDVKAHVMNARDEHLDLLFDYTKSLETMSQERDKSYKESEKKMMATIRQLEATLSSYESRLINHDKLIKGTQAMSAEHDDTLQEHATSIGNHANQISALESSQQQKTSEVRRLQEHMTTKLSQMDLRFQVLETASYDGTLLWKIRDYRRRKEEARAGGILSLYSQAFYTSRHGYRMCARVYLNGDGMGQGTHLSLFFVVMRGEYDALLKWPFRQRVSLMLLDQVTGSRNMMDTFRPDPSSTSFQKPTNDMNVASGCPLFVSHNVLEGPDSVYLKDDTIYIKIVVDELRN